MAAGDSHVRSGPPAARQFTTTHWSVVLTARQPDLPGAAAALEHLCATYWYPLYAYVRRRGHAPAEAEDLTQEFFARLLAKDHLDAVEPAKGRFRWFLLAAIKRLLINERDRASAAKRGGGRATLSLDVGAAEERYHLDASDQLTPDRVFDRAWAANLIRAAHRSLAEECALEGKSRLFEHLEGLLSGDPEVHTHGQVAAALGLTEGAVKVAIHRLRRRLRDHLREQIARTVASEQELEAELNDLKAAFSR